MSLLTKVKKKKGGGREELSEIKLIKKPYVAVNIYIKIQFEMLDFVWYKSNWRHNYEILKKNPVKSLTKNFGINSPIHPVLWEYADVHIYTVMYVH